MAFSSCCELVAQNKHKHYGLRGGWMERFFKTKSRRAKNSVLYGLDTNEILKKSSKWISFDFHRKKTLESNLIALRKPCLLTLPNRLFFGPWFQDVGPKTHKVSLSQNNLIMKFVALKIFLKLSQHNRQPTNLGKKLNLSVGLNGVFRSFH